MTKLLKAICLLCLAVLLLSVPALAAELAEPDSSRTVASVELARMPDKTVYVIGEEFSAEGGMIKVVYADGDYVLLPMTHKDVKMSKPTMKTANTKNVTATYQKKRVAFKIEVVAGMIDMTFDLNYAGAPAAEVQQVSKGGQANMPEAPVRAGYDFMGWYANPDFTHLYDFENEVTDALTVYALWKKQGAEHVNVTFDYDYYGVKLASYAYPVEKGTTASKPVVDPVRTGYTFDRWVNADGSDADFTQPLMADTTFRAVWKKESADAQTWIFEAEDTDLTAKIGPSYSGSAQEESMIIYNDAIGASNNRMVGYLYERGITLEFPVAADTAVTDAQIIVRISGEYTTMSYDGNDFQVLVNGKAYNYARVTLTIEKQTQVLPCEDLIVISGVSLNQGANLIQLKTNNTNAVAGTTFKANAPMVDCVKVVTDAVVIWDENANVPAVWNYQR